MTRPLPPCQALLGWPLLPIGPSGCTDDAAAGADHARAERSVKLCGEAGDIVDPDRRLCSAGSRREIIVPGGRDTLARRLDQALILAIARAKVWMRDLRARKYADTKEIAQRFQLSDAHVRRILRFGYLAPDIIEAIIEGRQPRSLTVKRLLRGIPCAWAGQRAAFGFAS